MKSQHTEYRFLPMPPRGRPVLLLAKKIFALVLPAHCLFVSAYLLGATTTGDAQAMSQAELNSIDSTLNINYFNSRPMPPNAYRVLFIGDSLMYHTHIPPGWPLVSGMAATAPEKDYVHLTTAHIQTRLPRRPVEMLVDNGGNGKIGTMAAYLKDHPELKPSLVVLQGGENDSFDETFRHVYRDLLDFFTATHIPYIVLGDWFDDAPNQKKDFSQRESTLRGYQWIDLSSIRKNPAYVGYGGPTNSKGVARHPNDAGMQAIADTIDATFDHAILPTIKGKH